MNKRTLRNSKTLLLAFLFLTSFFYSCNKRIQSNNLEYFTSLNSLSNYLNENSISPSFQNVEENTISYINGLFSNPVISEAIESPEGLSIIKLNNPCTNLQELTDSFGDEYIYFVQNNFLFSQFCKENLEQYKSCLLFLNEKDSLLSQKKINSWTINDFCNFVLMNTDTTGINLSQVEDLQGSINYASLTGKNGDVISVVKTKNSEAAETYGKALKADDSDYEFTTIQSFVIAYDTSCNTSVFYDSILEALK